MRSRLRAVALTRTTAVPVNSLERYFKVTLCSGCAACVSQSPDGRTMRGEHVLSQEDVTDVVKAYKIKAGATVIDIQDVKAKE